MDTFSIQDIQEMLEEFDMCQNSHSEVGQYTSIKALHKIIEGIDVEKKSLVLWATDARFSNDETELKEGYDFVLNIISKFDECLDSRIPAVYKLSNFEETMKHSENYSRISPCDIFKWFYDGVRTPFIMSFSKHIDKVRMWNTEYGHFGEGVCIVLDFSKMIYNNPVIDINSPFPIVYGNRLGNLPAKNQFIATILKEYVDYIKKVITEKNIDRIIEQKLQSLDVLFAFVSSYFKSEKWHYEQEVRMMCTTKEDNSIILKTDKDKGKMYIEVPIPISCIKKVIFGPRVKNDIVERFKTCSHLLELNPDNIFKSNEPLR